MALTKDICSRGGKIFQQKSHWQKTQNNSEPKNQFVVSNTVQ